MNFCKPIEVIPDNRRKMAQKSVQKVTLKSSDNLRFTVDVEITKQCSKLTNVEDTLKTNNNVITIDNVNGPTLKLIIQWTEHHLEEDLLDDGDHRGKNFTLWERDFVKDMDLETIVALTNAAHVLGVKQLVNLLCEEIAGFIKGMSTQQMRDFLHIRNDYLNSENSESANANAEN